MEAEGERGYRYCFGGRQMPDVGNVVGTGGAAFFFG